MLTCRRYNKHIHIRQDGVKIGYMFPAFSADEMWYISKPGLSGNDYTIPVEQSFKRKFNEDIDNIKGLRKAMQEALEIQHAKVLANEMLNQSLGG